MNITGKQYIGSSIEFEVIETFQAMNPETGEALPISFFEATTQEVDKAVKLAENAFEIYKRKTSLEKALFLETIADEILNLGDALIERCMQETALPRPRLEGERGRTMGQLKLFASVLREGSWVDARIDKAQTDRLPFPKPDIRHMLTAIGPVGVFGASNFPLAFSVAGGDTASALAAGCPVIVKGHQAHPGTSELVAIAILKAAEKTNMPNGIFSLVQGASIRVGGDLVKHPGIKAIGFTGSYNGGKALFDLANKRKEPIPVFAEMGSTNPVFILPNALQENGNNIAKGLVGSITLGVGQFCTNPGLIIIEQSKVSEQFVSQLSTEIEGVETGSLLTDSIKEAYNIGITNFETNNNVEIVASGLSNQTKASVVPKIFSTTVSNLLERPELSEEVFGPTSMLVSASSKKELLEAAKNLEGHITATVFGTKEDLVNYEELFSILENKVGRLIINGYPTGVEVCHSMVHGGPFPATTASQSTSVGTNAIKRFVRPVCFQNFTQELLPEALKDENALRIWRLIDGNLTKDNL